MSGRRRSTGRDRAHAFPGRRRAVQVRLSEQEYVELADAASRAGLTPTGYAAEAALAAARGSRPPSAEPWRQALTEVMAARTQVRRYATNVNQAVRELNATGEPPVWLDHAVALTNTAVAALDAAAEQLVRRLR